MAIHRFPEINTPRLVLRQLKESDWEVVSYLRTDNKVNRYVNRPSAETKEKALEFIAKITTATAQGDSHYWAISRKGEEKMIGSLCLWNFSADRTYAEVGYDLQPAHQGQGLMDEALKALLYFAFGELSIETLEAYTHRENEASRRLLLRNGFTLVPGKTDPDNANIQVFALRKSHANNPESSTLKLRSWQPSSFLLFCAPGSEARQSTLCSFLGIHGLNQRSISFYTCLAAYFQRINQNHLYHMLRMAKFALLLTLALPAICFGQSEQYKAYLSLQKMPGWTIQAFNTAGLNTTYKVAEYLNPFYLEADFNGDTKLDAALLVEEKASGKKGFIVFHQGSGAHFILGAGQAIGNGGDNFSWMDIWKVHRNREVNEILFDENSEVSGLRKIVLKGAGIQVAKSESASGLIYWNGKQYVWTQTGD